MYSFGFYVFLLQLIISAFRAKVVSTPIRPMTNANKEFVCNLEFNDQE